MSDDAPRLQPHDVQAERQLLGSCMLDANLLFEAGLALDPDDFYHTQHQRIWLGMLALARNSRPADPVAIGAWLEETGRYEPEDCADMHQMWADVIIPSQATSCIQRILDLSIQRKVILLHTASLDAAYRDECSVQRLLDTNMRRFGELIVRLEQRRSGVFPGTVLDA